MGLRALFRKAPPHRAAGPELYRRLIAEHVPGRTFIDVGCMWGVNGGYAFHALASGAARVVGLDVDPATPEFLAENEARGSRVEFVHGDVTDPQVPARLGRFDVVFCTGVLYHVPDPLLTLTHLRRLCGDVLILASPCFPEQAVPQSAVFLPGLDEASRRRLTYKGPHVKRGLDSDFLPEKGYGNWVWAFSGTCLRAMVETAGFTVHHFHRLGRLGCLVCAPGPGA